jgi:peptidoglycan-N-acetylglucosamine deacetylase
MMNATLRTGIAIILVVVAYGAYRAYKHLGALLVPAVITREMDPARTLSPSVGVRMTRLLRGGAPASVRPKLIALSFDDGPYPVSTPLLLAVLHDLSVPATFFLIGRDAQQFPGLARRIAEAGDEIADHTLTHPGNFERLDAAGVRAEILGGARALRAYSSDPAISSMMRPPHGRFSLTTIQAAQSAGYAVVLWNDDPGDWRTVPVQELESHIEAHATQPEILLLHSGMLATIEMMPAVVARFRAAGYQFVTVGELLKRAGATAVNDPAKHPLSNGKS